MLSISQAAAQIGVSAPTLRRWDRNGTFQAYRTAGNHRLNTFSPFPEHNLRR
ncbi:MAG: MerR family DNA-binding transcriptional regulator [Candidatus Lokiarchaeota archaeon]|nr:MerR family DNA-binding transcriptional regulator [Candidatus Lokiarchaeota archaeon]